MSDDIVVVLHAGRHVLDRTLVLDHRDSGTGGHCVVYRSRGGEAAILSGARPIGGWRPGSAGRWQARTDIDNFRQLYVGGVRAVRARGRPPRDIKLLGQNGYGTSQIEMADWANTQDIELCYQVVWTHTRCKVQSITRRGASAVLTMLQPQFGLARTKEGVRVSLPSYMENALELLDEPGEWYLDRRARTVHYLPKPGQGNGSTETGAYNLNGAMTDAELMAVVVPSAAPRAAWSTGATSYFLLTSEDEWYKAAYYNPAVDNYFDYPTSSDSVPSSDLIDPDPGNNANFYQSGYTIGSPYWRTEVGEFENSDSPYGTFDQGGNVWEWNETILSGSYRGRRGGSFDNGAFYLHASNRNNNNPTKENNNIGSRVFEAPEPQPRPVARQGGCRRHKPAARSARVAEARAAVPWSGTTRPSGVPGIMRAGEEEGPAVVSSLRAKGAAGPVLPGLSVGPHHATRTPRERQHQSSLRFASASEPILRSWFTANACRAAERSSADGREATLATDSLGEPAPAVANWRRSVRRIEAIQSPRAPGRGSESGAGPSVQRTATFQGGSPLASPGDDVRPPSA